LFNTVFFKDGYAHAKTKDGRRRRRRRRKVYSKLAQ